MFLDLTLEFAKSLDQNDPLKSFRQDFLFPTFHEKEVRYFTGNSLGLQPKNARKYILEELDDWEKFGVEGHFLSRRPWYSYHENLTDMMAKIVGAKPLEVVVTHSLTTNLHLLLVSFFQPKGKRTKILCEAKAFPSDQYALSSQIDFHGLNAENLVEIGPREGEHTIREEDIIDKINQLGDELALVMIGGVNYYTGQLFDMGAICAAGHAVGAKVGFDLAHAAGNVSLSLHDWGVDFAAWCGYKYLNSSPGGVSGFFVHERHANNNALPRFAGWWGHNKESRFKMPDEFNPIKSVEGWQLSNPPILSLAAIRASLSIFDEVGMEKLVSKSKKLTDYLVFLLNTIETDRIEIITPKERGCQISIRVKNGSKELFDKITAKGVVADWREPDVIRVAPVPLYNSFSDVFNFYNILKSVI